MIVLDTNVLSELMRPSPSTAVVTWLARQPREAMFTSVITEAELRYGAALLTDGKRRSALEAATHDMMAFEFAERILSFDRPAAWAFAQIAVDRRRSGRPISEPDARIAAIARSRGASVATRNVPDFEGCGIEVIDPWRAA